MFKAYINRFMRGNQLINTEELMFSVPSSNGFPITRPVVKANEDSAENFSFTMETNSPYYNSLLPLKTIIRIEYGENNNKDIIFNGRVLSIQTSSVYHTKNVVCAGYFSFLNDTYYEGVTENKRKKITLTEYINRIFSNHNTSAPDKPISKGTIGVTLPSDSDYYEPTGWTQTSTLFSNLANVHGGHLKVRYSGSTTYLDWYKYYARDLGNNRPSVTIGRNILDISSDTSADDIFTRVIPIGDTDSNGNTIYVDGYNGHSGKAISVTSVSYSDEFHNASDYTNAEANYGIIYKTVSFPEANTKEKLWNAAIKWIKDCYFGLVTSFTVKAVDMYITGESSNRILLGDCVNVTYTINQNGTINTYTRKLICKSVSYDLFNPENNSYTFGFPTDLLENNKDRKKSSKKKELSEATAPKSTVRSGGDSGPWTWIKVWHMIGERDGNHDYEGTNAATSFYNNGEMATVVTCYDPEEIKANLPQDYDTPGIRNNILIDDHQYSVKDVEKRSFKAKTIGRITLSGKPIKWVAISEDRGIFAYVSNRGINSVSYWYIKKKVKYDGIEAGKTEGLSTFEAIAQMIEKDTDGTWGGLSNANSFRSAGKVSGSIQKVYDPQEYASAANAKEDPNGLFSGDLVGRLGKTSNKYVAISKEYGIFGFIAGRSSTGVLPVGHWYMRGKGIVYDNVRGIFIDENGMYLTDDGDPDSNKTFVLDGDTGDIQDANGKVQLGYDTTQPGDLWQVELNVPITYTDKDGNVVTVDHFVKASDINLPSIPSFKTKIAVADAIIAGKVNAVDIAAERAYIKNLRGNSIVANTTVRAANFFGTNMHASSYGLSIPSESGSGYDTADLKNAFSNCLVYTGQGRTGVDFPDEKGKIYLEFYKIGGGKAQTVGFNIADTAAYQEAVSAAYPVSGAVDTSAEYIYHWYFNITSTDGTVKRIDIDCTSIYSAGRNAVNLGDFSFSPYTQDTPNTNTNTISISTTGRGNENNITKQVSVYIDPGSWSQNSKSRDILLKTNYNGTIYNLAKSSIDGSTIYNRGWEAARKKVSVPTSTASGASISIAFPTTTVDGAATTQNYTLSNDGNNKVKLTTPVTVNGVTSTVTVAEYTHNKYNAGSSGVTISSAKTWTTEPSSSISVSQNTVTFTTTGRVNSSGTSSEDTESLNLYSQASTDGLTATFYVTHTNSTDGNRIIKRDVTCSDSNFIEENIKSGVEIFGKTGTYEGTGTSANYDLTDYKVWAKDRGSTVTVDGQTWTRQNNANYYVLNGTSKNNISIRIYTYGVMTVDGNSISSDSKKLYDYVGSVPTQIYKDGYNQGLPDGYNVCLNNYRIASSNGSGADDYTLDYGTSITVYVQNKTYANRNTNTYYNLGSKKVIAPPKYWIYSTTSQNTVPKCASNNNADVPASNRYNIANDGYYYYMSTSRNNIAMNDECWYASAPSSGPGTITLPTGSMGTSDNPSSAYDRVETLGKKAKAAYGDYEWVIFRINCSCGAHKYVAFDPHQS